MSKTQAMALRYALSALHVQRLFQRDLETLRLLQLRHIQEIKQFRAECAGSFLFEFAPNLKVITGRDEENIEVTSLDELLPKGFRL